MMEETLTEMADRAADRADRFYGVAVGQVLNILDPLFLGRVQVRLPFIDDADLAPWARVAVPMAGIGCGHYFIPTIGDEVLVAFEHGDTSVPYVIGSLWNATSRRPGSRYGGSSMIMTGGAPLSSVRVNSQANPNAPKVPSAYISSITPTFVISGTRSPGTSAAIIKR